MIDNNLLSYTQSYLLNKIIENGFMLGNLYICDFRDKVENEGFVYYNTIIPVYDIQSISLPQLDDVYMELPYINQTVAVRKSAPNLKTKTFTIKYDINNKFNNFDNLNSLMLMNKQVDEIRVYQYGVRGIDGRNFRSLKDIPLTELTGESKPGYWSNDDYDLLDPNGLIDTQGNITIDDYKSQLDLISGDYGVVRAYSFKKCTVMSNILTTSTLSYGNSAKMTATAKIHFQRMDNI